MRFDPHIPGFRLALLLARPIAFHMRVDLLVLVHADTGLHDHRVILAIQKRPGLFILGRNLFVEFNGVPR